ncbi:MAG: glycine cleavage T C-terminal barrel domain-containing protein, partial [Caldilineaceae bacterium]
HLEVTPFHVGLDRWIRFDKREFNGRDALLRWQDTGIDTRWVGLVLESKTPVNVDDPVYSVADIAPFRSKRFSGPEAGELADAETPGELVGNVTVSVHGHSVNKVLAMAYVRTTHAWPGAKLVIMSAGRPIVATVTQTPFFDPAGARIRAKYGDGPKR